MIICLDTNEKWMDRSDSKAFANIMQLNKINAIYNLPHTHPSVFDIERSTNIDYCLCCDRVMEKIKYASLVPYELETLGDHRGIIVDIDLKSLLGNSNQTQEISSRKLTTSNPKALEKHLIAIDEKFEQQNIYKRAQKLLTRVKIGHIDSRNLKLKYEQLDAAVHGICTKAEKHYRPTISEHQEWSPKLAKGIKELAY